MQNELQREMNSNLNKEREEFSSKLQQLRRKMNQSNIPSSAMSQRDSDEQDPQNDLRKKKEKDDQYRIQSPVRKPNVGILTNQHQRNTAMNVSMSGESQRLEDSIN